MDKDVDFTNVSSCRMLNFGEENNASNHFQYENEKRKKLKEPIDLDDGEETMDDQNSHLEGKLPRVGQEFDSEEVAYGFYNEYARATGFSIRRNSVHKDIHGNILNRTFCCSCEGKRTVDKREVNVKSHRPETRYGCKARMKIRVNHSRTYVVFEFVAEHTHIIASPEKSHLMRSHRKISSHQAVQINNIEKAGILPKAGLDYMAQQVGGREKVGYILADLRNHLSSKRTMQMKEGAGGVLNYLQLRQSGDPNFFYAIQVDKDDLISNLFWVDGQMKADYAYFGDVVCFDTTYKKLKEGRPFALFVGVNHHKQTVVFGAALLFDETAETFMWLYDSFAKVMNGKKPKTILTDEDAAMAKALENTWPETCHRLCIWHIYQNAAKHLATEFSRFTDFLTDFSACIYNYEEEEEFLNAWQKMLERYALQNNGWLTRLFKKKEKWALVYGRQTFCADMITTQRSESMHSHLKKYVKLTHNSVQFLHHFERLVEDRRYEEMKADLRTSQGTPVTFLSTEILKHARSVYTHEVFKLFQIQLSNAIDSKLEIVSELGVIFTYHVTPFKIKFQHTVTYNALEERVSCSCKKFDFGGILCSHALKILISHNIFKIPELYVKKRWTKEAKKGICETFFQPGSSSTRTPENMKEESERLKIGERYKDICRLMMQLATKAAVTEEKHANIRNILCKAIEELDITPSAKSSKSTRDQDCGFEKTFVSKVREMQDPNSRILHGSAFEFSRNLENSLENSENDSQEITIRGWKLKQDPRRKSGKRLKSGLEKATSKGKSKKKLSTNMTSSDHISQNDAQNSQGSLSNLNSHYPHLSMSHTNAIPYVPQFQLNELMSPNAHQLSYCTQQAELGQNDNMSLTKLLQAQMLQQRDFEAFVLGDSTLEAQQPNERDVDGNAFKR